MAKKKTIILHRAEILYDIHTVTDKAARVRMTPGTEEIMAEVQSGDADEDFLRRKIDLYGSMVRAMMSAYMKGLSSPPEICDMTSADRSGEDGVTEGDVTECATDDAFVWNIEMPDTWNDMMFPLVMHSAHAFIVNMVLYEYFRTAMPESAASYHADAEKMKDELNHALKVRGGHVRRPLYPF